MEWTKENVGKTYITCRSARAYAKAIEFYESFGYKIMTGLTKHYPAKKVFCYVIAYGRIYSSSYETGVISECKEINPFFKPRRKFPRKMMVSNNNHDWNETLIYAKTKTEYPYVGFFENSVYTQKYQAWKYAKEID